MWNSWVLGPFGTPCALAGQASEFVESEQGMVVCPTTRNKGNGLLPDLRGFNPPAQELEDGILTSHQPCLPSSATCGPTVSLWTTLDLSLRAVSGPSIRSWGREGLHCEGHHVFEGLSGSGEPWGELTAFPSPGCLPHCSSSFPVHLTPISNHPWVFSPSESAFLHHLLPTPKSQ